MNRRLRDYVRAVEAHKNAEKELVLKIVRVKETLTQLDVSDIEQMGPRAKDGLKQWRRKTKACK